MTSTQNNPAPVKRAKLHGRAFYESIGSPTVILAPMVDQSEFAWRMLTRSFMPQSEDGPNGRSNLLAYTPMLHSRLFHEDPKYRRRMFEATREASTLASDSQFSHDRPAPFLDGNILDRPLTVQFCSNSPADLLAAAQHVAPHCDAVDLNLGCPQGIARKGHYGAFLQEDWSLIHSLINTLHRELDVPVTAKMRILETKEKTLDYARMILDAGASIITVHGRQREQKGHITGVADWSVLKYLREQLPPETVIVANGNILQHEDIAVCLEATGADAVMSAEGNLCDPSIFAPPPPEVGQEGREYWRGRDGKGGWRMDAMLRRYLDIIYRFVLETDPPVRKPLFVPGDKETPTAPTELPTSPGAKRQLPENDAEGETPPPKKHKPDKPSKKQQKSQSPNLLALQPHLFHMLRPLVSKRTHVRDALAKARGGNMEAFEHVLHLTETVTAEALTEYENGNEDIAKHAEKPRKNTDAEQEPEPLESSVETVRRCWRPWWVCQPYVRPLPAEAMAKGSVTLSRKERERLKNDESLAKEVGVPASGATKRVQPNGDA